MMLVIGSSGAVGHMLLPHWRLSDAPVVIQHRKGYSPSPGLQTLRWDPDESVDALRDWVMDQDNPPRAMVILAGVTPRSGRDLNLNTQIAETCLAAAHSVGVSRVLVASSSAVYGDHLNRPFAETDLPIPANAYGAAKLAMEKACLRWSSALEVVCLRIGNVAGADALLRQALEPDSSELFLDKFADGSTPERSYIGAGTMAEVLVELAALKKELPSVLNFAAPFPIQMGTLADAAGLSWQERSRNDTKGKSITLDCARLWGLLSASSHVSDATEMVAQLNLQRSME